MAKQEITPQGFLPVRPILIVGSKVAGKPNFFEVGGGGLLSTEPHLVAVPVRHRHHTLKGILENWTFSVNVPSAEQAKEADYCGIVSGASADKVADCGFAVFYGKLKTAPLIEQCPVNMECRVVQIIRSVSHAVVIGQIEATFISDELIKDGKPDFSGFAPLLWFRETAEYITAGQVLGKSRSIGNQVKKVA